MVAREPNIRDWFAADELERCHRCGENTALKVRTGDWIICTACGPVGARDGSQRFALPHRAPMEPSAG